MKLLDCVVKGVLAAGLFTAGQRMQDPKLWQLLTVFTIAATIATSWEYISDLIERHRTNVTK